MCEVASCANHRICRSIFVICLSRCLSLYLSRYIYHIVYHSIYCSIYEEHLSQTVDVCRRNCVNRWSSWRNIFSSAATHSAADSSYRWQTDVQCYMSNSLSSLVLACMTAVWGSKISSIISSYMFIMKVSVWYTVMGTGCSLLLQCHGQLSLLSSITVRVVKIWTE